MRAHSTRRVLQAHIGDALRHRLARSTGSRSTADFTATHEGAVGGPCPFNSPDLAAGSGVEPQHHVDDEHLSLAPLELEDPVVGEALDAQGIASSSVISSLHTG